MNSSKIYHVVPLVGTGTSLRSLIQGLFGRCKIRSEDVHGTYDMKRFTLNKLFKIIMAIMILLNMLIISF